MRYDRMFVRGALKVPRTLAKRNAFRAAGSFRGPKALIDDGYMTPVENQGQLPYCAAYSASSFAEAVLWKKNGYHKDIDPVGLYKYAKTIDGDPNGDGTYLECTLQALLAKGHFNPDVCRVKTFGGSMFGGSGLNDLKYAIHRYGCCVAGFDIDTSWYSPSRGVVKGGGTTEGGHAVTVYGYDEDGVLILNSWGEDYGKGGKIYLPNAVFEKQFIYGAVLTNCLNGME